MAAPLAKCEDIFADRRRLLFHKKKLQCIDERPLASKSADSIPTATNDGKMTRSMTSPSWLIARVRKKQQTTIEEEKVGLKRPRSLSVQNLGLIRHLMGVLTPTKNGSPTAAAPGGSNGTELTQRCVIVARDEKGFGLTVTGDNPVFVQSVREDGASARAGVAQGDRIIKVNGTLVTGANHMDVVKMITNSGNYVALTLLGQPPSSYHLYPPNNFPNVVARSQSQRSPGSLPVHIQQQQQQLHAKEAISGPQPVDEEKQAEWRKRRVQIVHQMLEEDRKHLEELRQEFNRNPNDRTQHAIDVAQKRLKNLESQLAEFGAPQSDATTSDTLGTVQLAQSRDVLLRTDDDSQRRTDSSLRLSESLASTSERVPSQCSLNTSDAPSTMSSLHFITPGQIDVIPMEDDDESDSETVAPLDTHGPFSNFLDLKTHPAHLAVFLHYLVSNGDTASLVFYLITDLYQHATGVKDLRKWAYEIHSSFLIPTAPARIASVDNGIIHEIDVVLASSSSDEDQLKRLFVKARQRALDEVSEQLADFRCKRTLGLGSVFGENLLTGLRGDRAGELRVVDALLMPHFDTLLAPVNGDFEALSDRTQVLSASLATIVRSLGVKPRSSQHEKLLEKCPTFVSGGRTSTGAAGKFKLRGVGSKKTVQLKGHSLSLVSVFVFTTCTHCQEVIWGINAQGYQCSKCDIIIHKTCAGSLDEVCCPPTAASSKPGAKVVKKQVSLAAGAAIRGKSIEEAPPIREEPEDASAAERDDVVPSLKRTDSRGRSDWTNRSASSESSSGFSETTDKSLQVTPSTAVSRSQSMRSRARTSEELRRQASIRTDRPASAESAAGEGSSHNSSPQRQSDVNVDEKSIIDATGAHAPHRGAVGAVSSSSSSLSVHSGLPESPSTSQDLAPKGEPPVKLGRLAEVSDSDLDAETEIPNIEDLIDGETLKHMKPKERKRQEVINELFHTERTHVRNLKVLVKVFYNPLLTSGILPPLIIKDLFANIDDVLCLHVILNNAMKACKQQSPVVGDIGDLMLDFFDGDTGTRFRLAASEFCQHQQHALDVLRAQSKKDAKLEQFLQEARNNPLCRKLELKDMIPMEMQRLTKYPLLLENVAKYTQETGEEFEKIHRCIELTRRSLDAVNTAKRDLENSARLGELQRRLDTAMFDKVQHKISDEFRALDLRNFVLVHEGPLQWRLGKNKAVDLHVVLLHDLLILLTRSSDSRLLLRFHNINIATAAKEDTKYTHCPVLKLNSVLLKTVATDKKAFFVVSTSPLGPQIYELVASTATEKKLWFKSIEDQVQIAKPKGSSSISLPLPVPATSGSRGESAENGGSGGVTPSASEPGDLAARGGLRPGEESKLNDSGMSDASQGEEEPVERIQIISQPRLINPSEVRVIQPTVYEHAEPVLTPIERLRRKDQEMTSALVEKQQILAKMFNLQTDELERLAEYTSEPRPHREAREQVLTTIVHANRLLEAINEGMKAKQTVQGGEQQLELERSPPAVACSRLTCIAAPLMKSLTQLLHTVEQEQDDIKRLRKELCHYKELAGGFDTGSLSSASSPSSSVHRSLSRKYSGKSSAPCHSATTPSSMGSVASSTNVDDLSSALALQPAVQPAPVLISSSEETLCEEKQLSTAQSSAAVSPSRRSVASPTPRPPPASLPLEDAVTVRNAPPDGDETAAGVAAGLGTRGSADRRSRQKRRRHTALTAEHTKAGLDSSPSPPSDEHESSAERPLAAVGEEQRAALLAAAQ